MSIIEPHILGFFYTTKSYQLRRLSFSRGVSHDRGRSYYRYSFANEHVSTIHSIPAHTTWIRHMGLDRRHTCQKERFRAQIQEHSRNESATAPEPEYVDAEAIIARFSL